MSDETIIGTGALLYHVSREPLEPGDEIRPCELRKVSALMNVLDRALSTNLGIYMSALLAEGIRSSHGQASDLPVAAIEHALERTRNAEYPNVPTRLDAAFFWPSLDLARQFAEGYRKDRSFILECELIDGEHHVGDMALVNQGIDLAKDYQAEIDDLFRRARAFWDGGEMAAMTLPEVLVWGRVVVRKRVP